MERDTNEAPLADATGMERPDDLPAMEPGDDESRRADMAPTASAPDRHDHRG